MYKENGEWKSYELPLTKLLVLTFQGNYLIPFTTIRRWTDKKERYYKNCVGKHFDIKIGDDYPITKEKK